MLGSGLGLGRQAMCSPFSFLSGPPMVLTVLEPACFSDLLVPPAAHCQPGLEEQLVALVPSRSLRVFHVPDHGAFSLPAPSQCQGLAPWPHTYKTSAVVLSHIPAPCSVRDSCYPSLAPKPQAVSLLLWGPHLVMLKASPGSALRHHSWLGLGTVCDAGDHSLLSACRASALPLWCIAPVPVVASLGHRILGTLLQTSCSRSWLILSQPFRCLL